MAAMDPTAMAGFKQDQVAALGPNRDGRLRRHRMAAMDPTAMAGFKQDQVAAFDPTAMAGFEAKDGSCARPNRHERF